MDGKDYFTLAEWKTKLMFLPVQDPCRCDEDQAEQVLYAMVQEGKLQEIELARFRPVT